MKITAYHLEQLTDEAGRIANLTATIAISAIVDAERGGCSDYSGALHILMERMRGYCNLLADIKARAEVQS